MTSFFYYKKIEFAKKKNICYNIHNTKFGEIKKGAQCNETDIIGKIKGRL